MVVSEKKYKLLFQDEAQTRVFASRLAKIAQPTDVILLIGNLGTGKTVLARAFIENITGETEVPSPTFTLVQNYEGPDVTVYHFDLYRIEEPNEIFELGIEEAFNDGIVLIEWPDKIIPFIHNQRLEIYLSNGRDYGSREVEVLALGDKWIKKLAVLDI